ERADLVLRHLGDHGGRAGAGAAALAGGHEDHVRALQGFLDLVAALVGRAIASLGIRARAEAARELRADLKLDVGIAHLERLRVRVDSDELDALEPRIDHSVDGVGAAAADADDLDHRQVATRVHALLPRAFSSNALAVREGLAVRLSSQT